MKTERSLVLSGSRSEMWNLLMDIDRVGACFPGVEDLTRVDDSSYQGTMKIRVGPVSLTVKGTLTVLAMDKEAWHASMRLEGADRRIGAGVRATIDMDLKELAADQTELTIVSDVAFLGRLGELGQPIIHRKAEAAIEEFAENLAKEAASI